MTCHCPSKGFEFCSCPEPPSEASQIKELEAQLDDLAARNQMLRTTLEQVAQAHAWLAFGECRSFGADVPLLAPAMADALAKVALDRNNQANKERNT